MDEESADALAVLAATSMVSVGVDTADYRELRLLVAPDASPPEDPAQAERWWLEVLRGELKRDPGLAAHLRSFLGVAPAPPVAGAVRNSLAGGTAHGPVVQAGTIGTLTLHAPSPSAALPDPGGWPTVGQLEPVAFGVRPAHRVRKHPLLPRYVLRDRDGDLGLALAQARSSGGLVLVLGEPFAGKSRAALAALGRGPAGLRVFAPAGGTDLRGLPALLQGRPERHVLWLDDLDEHLGEGGLEPRLLAQLTALRVVVLATMREDAYDACRAEPRGRALDLAHVIELAREWSPAERERLAREAGRKGDPRLVGAASASGPEGVAAYLALSPLLWDEWWRARRADRHPRGHALVRAALDLARCGLTGPLPTDLLLKVHEGYADVTGREREPAEDALAWAARPRHGLLPLLTRGTGDTWRAAPLLVEAAARHGGHLAGRAAPRRGGGPARGTAGRTGPGVGLRPGDRPDGHGPRLRRSGGKGADRLPTCRRRRRHIRPAPPRCPRRVVGRGGGGRTLVPAGGGGRRAAVGGTVGPDARRAGRGQGGRAVP